MNKEPLRMATDSASKSTPSGLGKESISRLESGPVSAARETVAIAQRMSGARN
jgi:hypothetical protein